MTKHIFVTGGVVSSLGKGLLSASIGLLLERRGMRVRMLKLDPYLNVDPGTMSPYQHGEVYVLDDGAETDLDLGHYERFTSTKLDRTSNYTTGQIYLAIIDRERKGGYRGKTVQVIPHVTDEIKSCIGRLATSDTDVLITEIGGTVGDIEGMPYFEAIRQYALDVGKSNCLFVHLTLVPYLSAAGELKTKPTQRSVRDLREIGIQPDVLICRTEQPIPPEECDKIALFCNVERRAVIEQRDRKSIYEVPLSLVEKQLDQFIVEKLQLNSAPLEIRDWQAMVGRIQNSIMLESFIKRASNWFNWKPNKSSETVPRLTWPKWMACLFRAASTCVVFRAKLQRFSTPASSSCRSSASASGYSVPLSSIRGMFSDCTRPTAPSSTKIHRTPWSACWIRSGKSRRLAERCGSERSNAN
jgi:CTP synthase